MYILIFLPHHIYLEPSDIIVIVYSSDLIKIARFTLNFVFIDKVEIK